MDLTPAETTLIDILRDKAGPVFTVSITKTAEGVLVTLAIPADGVHAAGGATFEAAFYALCGVEPVAGLRVAIPSNPSQH